MRIKNISMTPSQMNWEMSPKWLVRRQPCEKPWFLHKLCVASRLHATHTQTTTTPLVTTTRATRPWMTAAISSLYKTGRRKRGDIVIIWDGVAFYARLPDWHETTNIFDSTFHCYLVSGLGGLVLAPKEKQRKKKFNKDKENTWHSSRNPFWHQLRPILEKEFGCGVDQTERKEGRRGLRPPFSTWWPRISCGWLGREEVVTLHI